MPRVSVIIPAFNAATTIGAALRSVLEQSYDDWEVIVGDDGSTDATADLARAVSPRVTVVSATQNAGLAATRNLAISHASGELLAFLDADDRWLPEYLKAQLAVYDRETSRGHRVGVVACDAMIERPGGIRLPGTYRDFVPFPDRVTIESLLEWNPIFVSALVPMRVMHEIGGFDARTFGSTDLDLWLKIVERGYSVAYNPEALAVYTLHEGSMSARHASMARATATTYRLALERGHLSKAQRRVALQHFKVQDAIATLEGVLSDDADRGLNSVADAIRSAATLGAFAVMHPDRWLDWLRSLERRRAPWRSELRP